MQAYCEHPTYGDTLQATCPVTCGICTRCADDDDTVIALAANAGVTIGGCGHVQAYCEHPAHGETLRATCPVTCDSCGRRLADGRGAAQRPGELGSPDTGLLCP